MKLFMISLGGKVNGCNLEVHDILFVAANHIDETIGLLKNQWYGLEEKLHMDSYKIIDGADGYRLRLTKEKPDSKKKLYLVHLGGFNVDSTQELHQIGLFTGESEQEVKVKALKEIEVGELQNHVDHMVNVETCIMNPEGETYYIELTESSQEYNLAPDWFGYRRLDKE